MLSSQSTAQRPKRSLALLNQIPDEILNDPALNQAICSLPSNYNFEIHKSVWKLRLLAVKRVALQFPEGLLMYSLVISDILRAFGCTKENPSLDVVVLGDVTYGACCIDDRSASSLGCDFLIHYGHSCLVPVDCCRIKTMYVFVDIAFDPSHLVATICHNFPPDTRLALMGTVQFLSTLGGAKAALVEQHGYVSVNIPQERPLSPGEVLGCTSPRLPSGDFDAVIYVADGRFHLEAIMIANSSLPAYKYDPYGKRMTREYYEHAEMHSTRLKAIERAQRPGLLFGIIVGTLGRQSSPKVINQLKQLLCSKGVPFVTVTISEISAQKLARFDWIDVWIQSSCPRLSIDWGFSFDKPLLTPYEANVLFQQIEWQPVYPMDFYSKSSLGPWTPNYQVKRVA